MALGDRERRAMMKQGSNPRAHVKHPLVAQVCNPIRMWPRDRGVACASGLSTLMGRWMCMCVRTCAHTCRHMYHTRSKIYTHKVKYMDSVTKAIIPFLRTWDQFERKVKIYLGNSEYKSFEFTKSCHSLE